MKWLVALFVLLIPSAASARCFEPRIGPRNAVSARLPSFFAHGVALEYEHFLPLEGSLVGGLAVRKTAGGDYSSTTVVATTEARWWPLGEGPFGCRGRYGMIGLYVGLRLDVGATTLRDKLEDRHIGTAWTIATSSWLGWRFAIHRIHITPGIATMVVTEAGGGIDFYTRLTAAYDLTAGFLF